MSCDLPQPFRVLIYGKDARSDAIAEACSLSSVRCDLFAYSEYNNPGFLKRCRELHKDSLTDVVAMRGYASAVRPHLAIIGPEEPLGVGLVDALEADGIPCFGPYKDLARIETSKSWARMLLADSNIDANPEFRVFNSMADMSGYLGRLNGYAIKPDGLTGGKGVRLSGEHFETDREALRYADELIERDGQVLIEEKLQGEEFSLQTITDGIRMIHCPVVQDHKRANEGDTGPNTGGMGSYSCADFSLPFLDDRDVEDAKQINETVIQLLRDRVGRPYRGLLYGGFIATQKGVKLIEYNARFADPEGMNILPLMECDFLKVAYSCAVGELEPSDVQFLRRATVCKYIVPEGYPEAPVRNQPIVIPREVFEKENVRTFFAGVHQDGDRLLLTGSRGVAFVGIEDTLEKAEALAEAAAASVKGPVVHRRDIGTRSPLEARLEHMRELRGSVRLRG